MLSAKLASSIRARNAGSQVLPFGGWEPDRAPFAISGQSEAKNVYAVKDGYGPVPSLVARSNALDSRVLGAVALTNPDADVYLYAGTATKLYQAEGKANAFEDVSQAGDYTTATTDRWEFVQWGNWVLATNYTDPIQYRAIGVASSTKFADLITGTNKPKAKHFGVVGDFLMLGHTNDAVDGEKSSRVWWSGINDPQDFDPTAATQADFEDLPEGGNVTRIIGGREYALIFQESIIRRADYVGPPYIFDLSNTADKERGSSIPGGIVPLGSFTFFVSEQGFFYSDGAQSHPIGDGKVDQYFWKTLQAIQKHRVSATVHPRRKLVLWSYPATGGGVRQLFFNWADAKWSYGEVDNLDILMTTRLPGYTMDQLGTLYASVDIIPESLDSEVWRGGGFALGAFNSEHKLATFSGTNLAATITTVDSKPNGFGTSRVLEAWPLVDGGTITVTHGGRDRLKDPVSYGTAVAIDDNGKSDMDDDSRYHRFRVNIAAGSDWTHAQGVEFTATPTGER